MSPVPSITTVRIPVAEDLSLAADLAGPADGAAVILAHGGGQTRHSWAGAMRRLAGAGYRVINYDLLGHGDSDWSHGGDYPMERRSADLAAVCALANGPYALVGASLGGACALHAAASGQVDPAAIVLVDIVPKMARAGVDRIRAFMAGNPDGFATLDDAADAVAAYNPERPRPRDNSGLLKNLRLGDDGRYRWHWDPRMMASMDGDPHDMLSILDEGRPLDRFATLLVRGLGSDVVTDDGVADLRCRIPTLEVAEIGGAGHMVAGHRNDDFNDAVIAFLRRKVNPAAPTHSP